MSSPGPFISFLMDFGDTAPATCRGVTWSILPEARIDDLLHGGRRFGIVVLVGFALLLGVVTVLSFTGRPDLWFPACWWTSPRSRLWISRG